MDKDYIRGEAVFEDGEWWYIQPGDKTRRRIVSHAKKNMTRMFVNGKYIPKSHPLHKAGNYKSLDDAWSHNKIDSVPKGEVYAIVNEAWPEWVKIGCASIAEDRLNGYQTGSPYRDYKIVCTIQTDNKRKTENLMHKTVQKLADERRNEWFKISIDTVKELFYKYESESTTAKEHENA